MLRIGSLRQRITFQQLDKISDGQGGYTSSWTSVLTVWALIESVGGNERMFAGKLQDDYDKKIIIRNLSSIDTTMRVLFEGRYFQIHSIEREEERRWWTIIKAKEGVAS